MRALLAVVLFGVVGALSLIHVRWGRGSHWPEASEEMLARAVVGDGRRRMPSPLACFAVAVVLALVAAWPLAMLGHATEMPVRQVSMVISGVFVARGIAGYTPRWRQYFHDQPFTARDRKYYSPLCLVLGLGYAAYAAGGLD